MSSEDFDFIAYCRSRRFIKMTSGNMRRKMENNCVLELKFVKNRYSIPVTPDFYFSNEIPVTKEEADNQFETVQKIAGIDLPVLDQ